VIGPTTRRQRREPELPTWFKIWFAVCAIGGLAFLALIVWAIITVVKAVSR
jgi:hypothetical protein